jgi:hypothetical protein
MGRITVEAEPSFVARIFDFGLALLPYWWLLVPGGVLVVEPMIETFVPQPWKDPIDQRWPKETRHRNFRLASVAALLVASFLAFDDVSTRNRALQKDVNQANGKLDEARRKRDGVSQADGQLKHDPDTIYQLNKSVGTVVAPHINLNNGTILFEEIDNTVNLNRTKEFEYRDYVLNITDIGYSIGFFFGAHGPKSGVLVNVKCEIIRRINP